MSQQSETALLDAAIESARVFNSVVVSCAASAGLLDAAAEFSTAEEIAHRLDFCTSKLGSFEALLGILNHEGIVESKEHGGHRVYRAQKVAKRDQLVESDGATWHQVDADILQPWFGRQLVRTIRRNNVQFLGRDLNYFRQEEKKREFGGEYIPVWKTNLTNPLYEFGRVLAVRELAACGHRFLDLACGLGLGAERIAQFAPGAEILCVDKSADMLAEARRLVYPQAKVRFVHRDLNTGLPPIRPGSIDGILFNGAFHFIEDKVQRIREMARALRHGGLLVLGHCFCPGRFTDEAMHRFYFSTVKDPAYPISFASLKSLVSDNGFKFYKEYHRGSHSYLLAERTAWQPGKAEARL